MSMDDLKHCGRCGDIIPSSYDETWIWDDGEQDGPYHPTCALDLCKDDPKRFTDHDPAEINSPMLPDRSPEAHEARRMAVLWYYGYFGKVVA